MYNGYKGTAAGCPCNDKKPYKKAEKKRVIKSEYSEEESWNPYCPGPTPGPAPGPAPCAPCLKPGAGLQFQLIGQDVEPEFACGSAYLQWQDCEGRCYRSLIESEPDLNALQQDVAELQAALQTAFLVGGQAVPITSANLATVQAQLRLVLLRSGIYGPCSSSTTVGGFLRLPPVAPGTTPAVPVPVSINISPNAIINGLTGLLTALFSAAVGVTSITSASVSQQLCVSCNNDTGVLNTVVVLTTNLGTVTLTTASTVAICNTCTDGVSTPTFQVLTGNTVVASTIQATVAP